MDKKFILIGAIVSLIFFLGCTATRDRSNINLDYEAIHTGSEGVSSQFLPNLPPDKVIEDNTYNLGLKISNKGARDVNDGEGFLTIRADRSDIEIKDTKQRIILVGKSITNPKGEEIIDANHEIKILKLKPDEKTKKTYIFTDVCYRYNTEAVADVCIDTDLYNFNYREKVCKIKDISLSSQGGPIAVTKIKQNMEPAGSKEKIKPSFEITLANLGSGIPYSQSFSEVVCDRSRISEEQLKNLWNTITVSAEIPGSGLVFDCNGNDLGIVKLDRQKTLVCKTVAGIETKTPPYTAVLKITVDYGYTNTISKEIEITKLG